MKYIIYYGINEKLTNTLGLRNISVSNDCNCKSFN